MTGCCRRHGLMLDSRRCCAALAVTDVVQPNRHSSLASSHHHQGGEKAKRGNGPPTCAPGCLLVGPDRLGPRADRPQMGNFVGWLLGRGMGRGGRLPGMGWHGLRWVKTKHELRRSLRGMRRLVTPMRGSWSSPGPRLFPRRAGERGILPARRSTSTQTRSHAFVRGPSRPIFRFAGTAWSKCEQAPANPDLWPRVRL